MPESKHIFPGLDGVYSKLLHIDREPIEISGFPFIKMLYPEQYELGAEYIETALAIAKMHLFIDVFSKGGHETTIPEMPASIFNILRKSDVKSIIEDMNSRYYCGMNAGIILSYIWLLDANGMRGSVRKSLYITNKLNIISDRVAKECWSKFKNVAHCYAALYLANKNKIFHHTIDVMNINKLFRTVNDFAYISSIIICWGSALYDYFTNPINFNSSIKLVKPSESFRINKLLSDRLNTIPNIPNFSKNCSPSLTSREKIIIASYTS